MTSCVNQEYSRLIAKMCFLHVKVAKRDTQRAEGKAGVLMLVGQKQDKDKTPVMSTILQSNQVKRSRR